MRELGDKISRVVKEKINNKNQEHLLCIIYVASVLLF